MPRGDSDSRTGMDAPESTHASSALPVSVKQRTTKQALRRLAVFQATVLVVIIGISCLIILAIVWHYLFGAAPPQQQRQAVTATAPGNGMAGMPGSPMIGGYQDSPVPMRTGKGVCIVHGANGDMIRWRFQLEDEDDSIAKLLVNDRGAACILSESERVNGLRLDVVSAKGRLTDSFIGDQLDLLGCIGARGALIGSARKVHDEQRFDGVCAYSMKGRTLWRTRLPHPFVNDVAAGGDGLIYAVGVSQSSHSDARAQSCLCALDAAGRISWTYEHEGGLYWPQPLADGSVLIWSRLHYDKYIQYTNEYKDAGAGPDQQSFHLLLINRNGELEWTYDVGRITKGNAGFANGKVCVEVSTEGTPGSVQLVILSLKTGVELAHYPSGPVNAPPVMLADGGVLFQNKANILVKLSPAMEVAWTKALRNPVLHAPLVDSAGVIYFQDGGAVVSLETDGSERFRIPTGPGLIGHDIVWGANGMIYIPTRNEVLAFQPD